MRTTLFTLHEAGPAAFDNATSFLRGFGHIVIAWLWLDQVVTSEPLRAARKLDEDFAAGKFAACRYFFECELPIARSMLDIVASRTDVAAGVPESIF